MYATAISVWDDPGFTEGCFEIPSFVTELPTPEIVLRGEIYRFPKGEQLSKVRLPLTWFHIQDYSYISMEIADDESTDTRVYYGWIDSVTPISDDVERPLCEVSWHVDPWMTYREAAVFGYGLVTRRPWSSYESTPFQGYQYINRPERFSAVSVASIVKKTISNLGTVTEHELSWVILSYAVEGADASLKYIIWPVLTGQGDGVLEGDISGQVPIRISDEYPGGTQPSGFVTTVATAIPMKETFDGSCVQALGIDANAIIGSWLSPIAPFKFSNIQWYTTTDDTLERLTVAGAGWGLRVRTGTIGENTYGFYEFTASEYNAIGGADAGIWETGTLSLGFSTERDEQRVIGWDGASLGVVPYGMKAQVYRTRLILSATECQTEIRLAPSEEELPISRSLGMLYSYPVPMLDITSNAWSSYVYSGQRQYDISMRDEQSIKTGVQSIVGGSATGGMMGALGPIGLAVGALTGGLSGAVGMGSELLYFNDAIQAHEDRLHANQTNGILTAGTAYDVAVMGPREIVIGVYPMDSYSYRQISAEIEEVGISVDEETASCESMIKQMRSGFLQIRNLIVTGRLPPKAKRWIKDKFASGVRFI